MGGAIITPITPSRFEGLRLWLDGSDASTITVDGSTNISNWADKSGNGYDAAQTLSSARPNWSSSEYAEFDGNDWLDIASDLGFSSGDLYTLIGKFQVQGASTNNSGMLISGGTGSDTDGITVATVTYASSALHFRAANVDSSTVLVDGFENNLEGNFFLDTWHYGVIKGEITNTDGGPHDIGRNSNATNEFEGKLAELIIYDRHLNDFELVQLLKRYQLQESQILRFDGAGDYVNCNVTKSSSNRRFILKARLKPTAGTLISQGGYSPSRGWMINTSGVLQKKLNGGGVASVAPPSLLTDDVWHTIEYDFTVTNTADDPVTLHSAIIDGVDETANFTATPNTGSWINSTDNFCIGARDEGAAAPYFNGDLDYCKLYDNTDGVWLFDYQFGQGQGVKVVDRSGVGNHGTITGATFV
tara:strand:+ start:218 stop:1465 length:1248 start_codon:yes stop_codon:yes gene_type:complete